LELLVLSESHREFDRFFTEVYFLDFELD